MSTMSSTSNGRTPAGIPNSSLQKTASEGNPSPVFDLVRREDLRRLVEDQGMTDAQIGRMFGVSTNQVHRRREQMNLVQGHRSAQTLAHIVRLSEAIKTLPDEAITEIEGIVGRYSNSSYLS